MLDNPGVLKQCFDDVVGEYINMGMGGVRVDVPALMKWESIADRVLQKLTLPEIQAVYKFYRDQSENLSGHETGVILSEIKSVCSVNTELKPYLKFGGMMSETRCDVRVSHLVGGSGRFISNLDEALDQAICAQSSISKNDGISKGP